MEWGDRPPLASTHTGKYFAQTRHTHVHKHTHIHTFLHARTHTHKVSADFIIMGLEPRSHQGCFLSDSYLTLQPSWEYLVFFLRRKLAKVKSKI